MPDLGPITRSHTSFADLDLLLAEGAAEHESGRSAPRADERELELETLDAQILAALVSP